MAKNKVNQDSNDKVMPGREFPHSETRDSVLAGLEVTENGLSGEKAKIRLHQHGPNSLPTGKSRSLISIFLHQFTSPLIYVLLAAAILSVIIHEYSDAGFIAAVLLINAFIGSYQEYSAQRAAEALRKLVTSRSRVIRDGEPQLLDAEELVPGDVLLLESGDKIPADIRLLECHDFEVDESLLTGESVAVLKDERIELEKDAGIGDRINMAFAGTLVSRGRARGVIVATGMSTFLGRIAADVLFTPSPKAPLQIRMDKFVHKVAIFVLCAAVLMFGVTVSRGLPWNEMFLMAVALVVSVIPEGLPVALTVALAIGMGRMSKRNVIVRRLLAVESLGSCTFIATDKTGTLTVNQLTVKRIAFPHGDTWQVSGEGMVPDGSISTPQGIPNPTEQNLFHRLCLASILTNEATLTGSGENWNYQGDAVDVSLLVMARKGNIIRQDIIATLPEISTIPYESERAYSAGLHQDGNQSVAFVKGAFEKLLPMCTSMMMPDSDVPMNRSVIEAQANALASQGYRVLAMASGPVDSGESEEFEESHLKGLTFLGLVAIIDPLRPEVSSAVEACKEAGIKVAMITGDHPATALAIARELDMADNESQVVTGAQLAKAADEGSIDDLTKHSRVFARVGPRQKLEIVESLQRLGHFVAVSGDGVNDAPALRAAQVGVAMGKSGTDVARETADLVVTDDNFASIVAGVEEGRVAFSNVRKVIFLLISTGLAELILFTLSLISGLPMPLLAVQLLWLNLVTNGIQDVALAFEPAEGHELRQPPRSPNEPIFNRLMLERVVVSAVVVGGMAFLIFQSLIAQGVSVEAARNSTLLLMVLFENVHVFNSRSETLSTFRHNLFRNKILLVGTAAAQLIHIGAMYTPWIKDVLQIQPVDFNHWLQLLGLAVTVLIAVEIQKLWWNKRHPRPAASRISG